MQQMIGWMPSSWKEKELEVDMQMNEMYMNRSDKEIRRRIKGNGTNH
jgi:hypothetical protein